jgi:Putative binding domain, N-terminal
VATMDECPWSATSNASWLSITSGGSGTGDGTVAVSVAANTGDVRTGTVTIADRTVTVNQASAPCSYSAAPTSISISALGGAGTPVSVTTFSVCAWTAASNANWLTILTGANGTGSGTVSYSVLPNTGSARTGTLTVAERTVTISQSAPCTYAISPISQTVPKSSGTGGPVSVTTQVGCPWTAVSKVSWITVTSGANGTGNGTVTFSVAANDTGGSRNGEIAIAGSIFTVAQQQ